LPVQSARSLVSCKLPRAGPHLFEHLRRVSTC
jgi:hypothetical protein